MKSLFADTSFFIALLDQGEATHSLAVSHLLSDRSIITSEFVFVELGNAMSPGDQHEDFVSLVQSFKGSTKARVIPLSSAYFERAVKLMASRNDKDWSLVDCTSFEIMRDLHLEEALSTDKHFEQAGFRALLRSQA